MEPGSNDFCSGNVNANLRNPSYRISAGIPVLDDSSSGYRDNIGQEKPGNFMCLSRPQAEYMHGHTYSQNSSKENDSHFLSGFNELSQSCSRKHSLSGVVRTRRRKAGISEEERVCIVCGEPASGYNFDRLTCESCKAFFRRNALKPRDKIKACNRGGGCAIEGNQRKHCPSCRLEKCLTVGMKRELILPPEKLEQRAKPRRRKHHSPQDSSSSPQHLLTGPSSVGSSNTTNYPSYLPSPLTTSSHPQSGQNHTPQSSSYISGSGMPIHLMNSVKFPGYINPGHRNDISMTTDTFNSSGSLENKECNFLTSSLKVPLVGKSDELFLRPVNQNDSQGGKFMPLESSQQSDSCYKLQSGLGPTQCRRTGGRTFCQHRSCRIRFIRKHRQRLRRTLSGSKCLRSPPMHIISPDPHLLNCLQSCIRRIREPFTPDEQLETGVAVTLEQEYNRMDACIRRIIRVVKLLPYFSEVGKPAQLSLLRTNIYGLIVLYSSFFFERDIRKLRYPVLQLDGQLTTVTVSMLDEVATPSTTISDSDDGISDTYSKFLHNSNNFRSVSNCRPNQVNYAIGLREEFELYKSNTLAAFDHLDELVGSDDILRMCVLAIKLFSDNSLTEDLRAPVYAARQAYSLFLWNYIRWQAGSKRLRYATELYARILIAFIDLRTLEIRMTEFAKLLSLDGLSPLMREVCSQRSTLGSTSA
uniref:Nuclear receptor domain-containing protein n=1 Tax=Trichobilharzia regenti TaxID=157069 RepID=A0AA85J0F3_TRIRE|nr:unnamed protein product [Trichobilharzia regenti]